MESNSLEERQRRFDVWRRTVRDPAEESSEGLRTLSVPGATAEYEIGPLPNGKWAVRYSLRYWSGAQASSSYPWTEVETRQAGIETFLEAARRHFPAVRTSEIRTRRDRR